jgi:hypothetical protein
VGIQAGKVGNELIALAVLCPKSNLPEPVCPAGDLLSFHGENIMRASPVTGLHSLPKDIIVHGIIPHLAEQFQIFSIIAFGCISQQTRVYCQDLLDSLNGKKNDATGNEDNQPIWSGIMATKPVWLANLQTYDALRRGSTNTVSNAKRAVHAILRQAWERPGGGRLLASMSGDALTVWETLTDEFDQIAEDELYLEFQMGLDLAVDSEEAVLPVLQAAGAVQKAVGGRLDLGRVVAGYLEKLTEPQKFEFLNEFFGCDQVFKLAPLKISSETVDAWLCKQFKDGQFEAERFCKLEKFETSSILRFVEFVCRQYPKESPEFDCREVFFQSFEEQFGRHISKAELEEFVEYLDCNPEVGCENWVGMKAHVNIFAEMSKLRVFELEILQPQLTLGTLERLLSLERDTWIPSFKIDELLKIDDGNSSSASNNSSSRNRNAAPGHTNSADQALQPPQDQAGDNLRPANRRKKKKKGEKKEEGNNCSMM